MSIIDFESAHRDRVFRQHWALARRLRFAFLYVDRVVDDGALVAVATRGAVLVERALSDEELADLIALELPFTRKPGRSRSARNMGARRAIDSPHRHRRRARPADAAHDPRAQ